MALSHSIPLLNNSLGASVRRRVPGKARARQRVVEVTIFMRNMSPELTFADVL